MSSAVTKKWIAMVIAMRDFRDEEYFIPKNVFLNAGFEVVTAGLEKGSALGVYGGVVETDIAVSDIELKDFDVVVFVGGSGALGLSDNSDCLKLAKQAVADNKVVGAICIAPVILAKAGVLQGRSATVWQSAMDKSGVKILKDKGCEFTEEAVVVDGRIITANSAEVALKFGEAVVRVCGA